MNPEIFAEQRQRIARATESSQWGDIPPALNDALWRLAELRPDFEGLLRWVAEADESGAHQTKSLSVTDLVETSRRVLRAVCECYGLHGEQQEVDQMEADFVKGRAQLPVGSFALFLTDVAERAFHFGNGVQKLPLAIEENEIVIGRNTRISLNRTLRVPEDGKQYPLPAGFGRLPILRVEDYAKQVPAKWLEEGGFIIPLYQREALFLEFSGVKWRPTIGKVAVGRVNAVTGKPYDLKIRSHSQDYVVIPEQRWLDGINSGTGTVKQFVAMPLGQGYTIEAQVTDEEKHGGFQIAVFDPKSGRFPEQDPEIVKAAAADRKSRSFKATQQDLIRRLPEKSAMVIQALQSQHYQRAAERLGIPNAELLEIVAAARSEFEKVLGINGFTGIVPHRNLELRREQDALFAKKNEFPSLPKATVKMQVSDPRASGVIEMGIAAGGTIEQQIHEDTYGAESWDANAIREIPIHIVNSAVYEQITGLKAPPSPITVESYQENRIPWYSNFEETSNSVKPAGILRRIFSIGQIDKLRGVQSSKRPIRGKVTPEQILRIHTPTVAERFAELFQQTTLSCNKGYYAIAIRQASQALELFRGKPIDVQLKSCMALLYETRARANLRLGRHADSEVDASECLKLEPKNLNARSTRALALLGLQDYLLARDDAEKVVVAKPDSEDAKFVLEAVKRQNSKGGGLPPTGQPRPMI